MKLTNYLIYRHGSNAANQSMTNKLPIAIIEETSKENAVAKALKEHTCYANQFLSAVTESKANKTHWNTVAEEESILASDGEV